MDNRGGAGGSHRAGRIALLRASPQKYACSSSGTGAAAHPITAPFNSTAGIKALHIPYRAARRRSPK